MLIEGLTPTSDEGGVSGLQIGTLKLKSNLILAPMAGVSDFPFRMLNRRFGCELAFVEMLNCRSVSFKSRRTKQMLFSNDRDRPLGIQLLGCELAYIQKALEVIKGYKFDLFDFNAACPAKKVVRRGEGAGLMRTPDKLKRILEIIVREVETPVTVKLRLGWDKDSINIQDVAMMCQDSGVGAIFIHGRTKTQGYSGGVDYNVLRQVKKSVDLPLIASGDIFNAALSKRMLDETGADGLAVARGALGNPWIFKEIAGFLNSSTIVERPSQSEIVRVMAEHLDMCVDFHGEKNGVVIFRKFFSWYTKGFRNIRQLRETFNRTKTKEAMLGIIEKIKIKM